jgi:hypothetical protein
MQHCHAHIDQYVGIEWQFCQLQHPMLSLTMILRPNIGFKTRVSKPKVSAKLLPLMQRRPKFEGCSYHLQLYHSALCFMLNLTLHHIQRHNMDMLFL